MSHGYVSTRYNLSSLAGQALRIRFRNTSDSASRRDARGSSMRCGSTRVQPIRRRTPRRQRAPALIRPSSPLTVVTLDGSGSEDSDGYLAEAQWTLVSGPPLALNRVGRSLSFAAPIVATQDTFLFRLTVTDNRGAVASDEATVTVVNRQPVVVAGPDQMLRSRSIVNLSGQATDGDGTIASLSMDAGQRPFGHAFRRRDDRSELHGALRGGERGADVATRRRATITAVPASMTSASPSLTSSRL